MMVEFKTNDDDNEFIGFSTFIHYSQLPSKECKMGLDMIKKTIQSPNYPDSYDNDLTCKWLISVPHGSHITLSFSQFDVRFLVILISSDLFSNHCYCLFLLQMEDTNDFLSIHNGGSDDSEMVTNITGQIKDTKVSTSGNQMFVVLHSNEEIVRKGFHAMIMESKYHTCSITSRPQIRATL